MRRALQVTVSALALSLVHAQTPAAPSFEAASIKAAAPGKLGGGISIQGARFRIVNSSLKSCVQMAWNVHDFQVSGATGWMDAERFDIDAVAASPIQGLEHRAMLQSLLADRFGLVIHRETRERQGYALVVGHKGAKLLSPTEHTDEPSLLYDRTPDGNFTLTAASASMKQLTDALSFRLGAIVVDQTGLDGKFDFSLEFGPETRNEPTLSKSGEPLPPPPADSAPGPSIFSALQEKLGLKLEARKLPVEVIVIDRANRPTEN
jgi:uncharacterized protein (TIGR03435 family)